MTVRPQYATMLSIVAAAAAMALVACDALRPHFPDDATRYEPSIRYKAWWQAVEACSGRTAPLGAIHWYSAGEETIPFDEDGVNGIAYRGTAPVIVIASRHLNDGDVVRHEMLHVLLDRDGHPGEYFVQRCGGIVTCQDACLREAGYPTDPPVADTTVDIRLLPATVRVYPNQVSLTADSGWVTVVVETRNPLPRPVAVLLPTPTRIQRLLWYDLQAIARDSTSTFLSQVVFGPSAPSRAAFDVRISPQTSPGSRELRGGFSINSAATATLQIRP